jgi:hypothetical protein
MSVEVCKGDSRLLAVATVGFEPAWLVGLALGWFSLVSCGSFLIVFFLGFMLGLKTVSSSISFDSSLLPLPLLKPFLNFLLALLVPLKCV